MQTLLILGFARACIASQVLSFRRLECWVISVTLNKSNKLTFCQGDHKIENASVPFVALRPNFSAVRFDDVF